MLVKIHTMHLSVNTRLGFSVVWVGSDAARSSLSSQRKDENVYNFLPYGKSRHQEPGPGPISRPDVIKLNSQVKKGRSSPRYLEEYNGVEMAELFHCDSVKPEW